MTLTPTRSILDAAHAAGPVAAKKDLTYTVTEERQVGEEVRKEQIDVEGDRDRLRDDQLPAPQDDNLSRHRALPRRPAVYSDATIITPRPVATPRFQKSDKSRI